MQALQRIRVTLSIYWSYKLRKKDLRNWKMALKVWWSEGPSQLTSLRVNPWFALKALALFFPWLENCAKIGCEGLVANCKTFLAKLRCLLTREEANVLLHTVSNRDKTGLSSQQKDVMLEIYKLLSSVLDGNPKKRPREETAKVGWSSVCYLSLSFSDSACYTILEKRDCAKVASSHLQRWRSIMK